MREYVIAAVEQIETAAEQLTPSQYRTARRLLDRVASNGELHLDGDHMMQLCGTDSPNTMRAHLIALRNANIIQYAINHQVYIGFLAWPMIGRRSNSRARRSNLIAGRSEAFDENVERSLGDQDGSPTDQNGSLGDHSEPFQPDEPMTRSLGDQIRALGDQKRSLGDQIRAQGDQLGGIIGGVGWLGSTTSPILGDLPTNQPGPNDQTLASPDAVEQALSAALLIAAGMIPKNAKRLAAQHPFELIQRATGHWWEGAGDKFDLQPSIVVNWLDNLETSGIPTVLSPRFQRSELYLRHRTRAQLDAEESLATELAPQPPPAPIALSPLAALWESIVAGHQPGVQAYLRQAQLVELTAESALIQAPRSAAQWLSVQLARRLKQDFALSNHPVAKVEIQGVLT